ncbi:MAG: hypothetical protein HY717_10180 [Planctomycetes bacterium]|nr:hypothetical protein [Planctomycetota bacterium]
MYEAMQESLGRRVALKVLPFHHLLDQKRLERFRREARAAAALQHPHIVPVHGIGEEGGLHYYAMQFVPGHGLDRVLLELKRLQKEEAGEKEGSDSSLTSTARLLLESPAGAIRRRRSWPATCGGSWKARSCASGAPPPSSAPGAGAGATGQRRTLQATGRPHGERPHRVSPRNQGGG